MALAAAVPTNAPAGPQDDAQKGGERQRGRANAAPDWQETHNES